MCRLLDVLAVSVQYFQREVAVPVIAKIIHTAPLNLHPVTQGSTLLPSVS